MLLAEGMVRSVPAFGLSRALRIQTVGRPPQRFGNVLLSAVFQGRIRTFAPAKLPIVRQDRPAYSPLPEPRNSPQGAVGPLDGHAPISARLRFGPFLRMS